MRIEECRTNHLENPLGYKMEQPVFSYVVTESRGKRQEAARIVVAADAEMEEVLFDTGWSSGIDSLAYKADLKLKPCTRYFWTVSVRSDQGEEALSEVNWFETGKRDQKWDAEWITCGQKDGRHPWFSKDLEVKGKIKQARLYICGLGLYEAYLNGEKIGEECLTPYCNNYEQWLQYQTYDVTQMLKKGGRLEVLLGNGWYKGRFGFDQSLNQKGYFSDSWKLIAQVQVVYEDGSFESFGTDESWKVRYGCITESSIYDGEVWDMTLIDTPEEAALICGEKMAPLTDRLSTPVEVRETLTPTKLIMTPAGETVLDLGQNLAGVFRLKVNVPRGEKVYLQFGEILQNGCFYRDNLRTAKAEFTYISDGEERVIQPHFTFYGYRYVKVEGIENLKKEDFTACVLYSLLPQTGTLTTGQDKVNRLILNTQWGQKGNFIDMPTDCPQRDERMGWTGDAQVFSPTACFLRDSYAFYRKYLYDCWQEQLQHDGEVPNVIPAVGNQGSAAVWGDAACIIPWNVYLFYGDQSVLEEQFESMKAWVDFVERKDGDDFGWRKVFHYGDWLALDNPMGGTDQVMGGTDTGFIASVYYANSARLTAKAARILGREEEAAHYEALADKVRREVKEEFYSLNERCCINTQTALIMTLYFDLTENKDKTRQALKQKFNETGHKLQTGFVGTPLMCNVLSDNGMDDLAYELLLNEEYPGWLYEVNLGATTIWERWNSVMPDGSISSTGMNSLNHYSYGSIVEWMFRHCAGINPVEEAPGFRRAVIKPVPNWTLRHLEAECRTAAGTYRSAWKALDENHMEVRVEIPFNCEARLTLPLAPESVYEDKTNLMFTRVENGECILTAGSYCVTYETTKPLVQRFSTYNTMRELLMNPKVKEVLMKVSPMVTQLPPSMWDMSMRQIVEKFSGGSQGDGMMDQLDAMLAKLD